MTDPATWGEGQTVILVHGSLATADDEWETQRMLTDAGFRFVAPNRRGYEDGAQGIGEDFLLDAADITDLMDGGAHLVGHSYGGIGVLLAAAARPTETLSVTVLEPAVVSPRCDDPAVHALVDEIRSMWTSEATDEQFVVDFLRAVGSDPDEFPPDFLTAALPLVPVFRAGRPFWDADIPHEALDAGDFPTLVVSGGHHPGFDGICDDLAASIGASRAVVAGAGHEIQFAESANQTLLDFWRSTAT